MCALQWVSLFLTVLLKEDRQLFFCCNYWQRMADYFEQRTRLSDRLGEVNPSLVMKEQV